MDRPYSESSDGKEIACLSLNLFSFIDEHYRYVIFDMIEEFARITDETVLLLVQPEIALALWARKDVKEFLLDRHV